MRTGIRGAVLSHTMELKVNPALGINYEACESANNQPVICFSKFVEIKWKRHLPLEITVGKP